MISYRNIVLVTLTQIITERSLIKAKGRLAGRVQEIRNRFGGVSDNTLLD